MSGQTIRAHAERIIHRSELRDANESIVRVANLDDARAIIDAIDNAYEILEMSRHTGARYTAIEAALALLAPDPEVSP